MIVHNYLLIVTIVTTSFEIVQGTFIILTPFKQKINEENESPTLKNELKMIRTSNCAHLDCQKFFQHEDVS
jgi:hypothetical protein